MGKVIIDVGAYRDEDIVLGDVSTLMTIVKPVIAQHVVNDGRLQAVLDAIAELILRIPPVPVEEAQE